MDRITIDVTRTRGTRVVQVRVHVNPVPGVPGSSWRQGSVQLGAQQTLDVELAAHIAHSVEQALAAYEHLSSKQPELGI